MSLELAGSPRRFARHSPSKAARPEGKPFRLRGRMGCATTVAPIADNRGQEQSIPVLPFACSRQDAVAASGCPVNGKGSLSFADKEPDESGRRIRTADLLSPRQDAGPSEPQEKRANARDPSTRCTTGCTSEAKTEQTDPVATIAAALLALSADDRARLAAILASPSPNPGENTAGREGRTSALRRERWLCFAGKATSPPRSRRWLPVVCRRCDVWGFGDVLAANPTARVVLIVQATTADHVADRLAKARRQPELTAWLRAGAHSRFTAGTALWTLARSPGCGPVWGPGCPRIAGTDPRATETQAPDAKGPVRVK